MCATKGWQDYVREDDHFVKSKTPPNIGELQVYMRSNGTMTMSYDKNWNEPLSDWGKLGRTFTVDIPGRYYDFATKNDEENRIARKYVFGFMAAGSGGATLLAEGAGFLATSLAGADIVIVLNDGISATIDATDNKDKDIDLMKDFLTTKFGEDAGKYFESGKVLLGAIGLIENAVGTFRTLSQGGGGLLQVKYLTTLGGMVGTSDDAADALNLRDKESSNAASTPTKAPVQHAGPRYRSND